MNLTNRPMATIWIHFQLLIITIHVILVDLSNNRYQKSVYGGNFADTNQIDTNKAIIGPNFKNTDHIGYSLIS